MKNLGMSHANHAARGGLTNRLSAISAAHNHATNTLKVISTNPNFLFMAIKKCEICESIIDFTKRANRSKTCSDKCSKRLIVKRSEQHYEKIKDARSAKLKQKTKEKRAARMHPCEECGKLTPNKVACSRKCIQKIHARPYYAPRILVPCMQCTKPMVVTKREVRKVCSDKCRTQYQRMWHAMETVRKRMYRKPFLEKVYFCDGCGEQMVSKSTHAKWCNECAFVSERQSIANSRARRNNAEGVFTGLQWKQCQAAYDYKCAYCGSSDKLTQDHYVPLNPRPGEPKGTHTIDNIRPACQSCNSHKNNLPFAVFAQRYPERIKRPQLEGLLQYAK